MNAERSASAFGHVGGPVHGRTIVPLQPPSARAVVSQPDRDWRATVVDKLKELAALPVGWDGYAAPPVSFATAEFALRMLEVACSSDCACPQIVPGARGDLQIEWHSAEGSVELHVKAPLAVHAWRTGFGLESDEELDLTNNFIVVVEWLRSLMRNGRASSTAAA
jgi:hypothetical protein